MKEEFLHYLWKHSLYYKDSLYDSDNNKIIVLDPGEYNHDSGPDFFNARIYIAGTEWAGNVEIHLAASHFDSHGHNRDHAYDNVILHVVAENDKKVFNARGEELLTVEIRYDNSLHERYTDLVNNPFIIACQPHMGRLDKFFIRNWLSALVTERMQHKADIIMKILIMTGNDWEETLYRVLSRYFGFRVNSEPFELLASALPFKIIRKHADNRFQIESLLFGTAGMLDESLFREAVADDYYLALIKEYKILSAKYSLKPIHGWQWKFSRLRPVNFPTIRISQLASMLTVAGGLFSRTLEAEGIRDLKQIFEVTASGYWDDHYVFGKKSRKLLKNTGTVATDIFLINAVIPVIFLYGRYNDKPEIIEKALAFLEEISPELNSVTSDWKLSGIECESAFYSQALLQLTNEYCRKRRCLECRIGCKLISEGKTLKKPDELVLEP